MDKECKQINDIWGSSTKRSVSFGHKDVTVTKYEDGTICINKINTKKEKSINLLITFILFLMPSFIEYLVSFESSKQISIICGFEWVLFMLVNLFFLEKEISKYHSAEHKAVKLIKKGKKLTIENMKQENPITSQCGMNFLIFILNWSFILLLLPLSFFVKVVISLILTKVYLFLMTCTNEKIKARVFAFGIWYQKTISIKEPDTKHLLLAIECMNELLLVIENKRKK